jgi:hypothetical protein
LATICSEVTQKVYISASIPLHIPVTVCRPRKETIRIPHNETLGEFRTRTRIALTSSVGQRCFPRRSKVAYGLLDRPQREWVSRFQSGITVIKKIKPTVATTAGESSEPLSMASCLE